MEVLFDDGVAFKWDFAPNSTVPFISLTESSINRRSDVCCSKGVSKQYLLGPPPILESTASVSTAFNLRVIFVVRPNLTNIYK